MFQTKIVKTISQNNKKSLYLKGKALCGRRTICKVCNDIENTTLHSILSLIVFV